MTKRDEYEDSIIEQNALKQGMTPIKGNISNYPSKLPTKSKNATKTVSRWGMMIEEVSNFTGNKDYGYLGRKLAPLKDKPEWILDFIKQAKTGREPIKFFWWLIKENVK